MRASAPFLGPSEAAERLGISVKALRIYEQHGLVTPLRTSAGWRAYGPDDMGRAADVALLRGLGFSLAQVAQALKGDRRHLGPALAAHQAALEERIRHVVDTVEKVRRLRADLLRGPSSATGEDAVRSGGVGARHPGRMSAAASGATPASAVGARASFALPWPWGGERFELRVIRPLNYIVGPLGSGKTRLAMRIAEMLPDAAFLGLERMADGTAAARARLKADPALMARVQRALTSIVENGGTASDGLLVLIVGLEAERPAILVVDMVEHGLDHATQEALAAHLRRRGSRARPLFLMTRSCAILDLAAVGADEAIILCPANHGPPMHVAPRPGAEGYEAVATCLAMPAVRARTEGVIAWRPVP
ncbi:MerR family transcriptional regulator [Chelatococcus reniformis]|uniref:HTH merR-type domain-containing protein n=1 Tax=Chelatococcus reniformis TaxID=1494448 RepID=A0A916XMB2_9HYPH|nr:MerR family transcriptional regulator [Chelatococcus reniformis]GGC86200.1 hypothetical protein GCM10010994_50120 [Chelatococcus reniformis]